MCRELGVKAEPPSAPGSLAAQWAGASRCVSLGSCSLERCSVATWKHWAPGKDRRCRKHGRQPSLSGVGGVVLGLARLVLHHCPFPAGSLCPLPPPSCAPATRGCRRSLAVPAAQFPPLTVIRLVHPETLLQVLGSDFGVQDLLPHRTGEPAPLLIMQTLPKDPA